MSEAHFSLIFRGRSVDDGEIDVRDLAPALLAVGDLLQAANHTINGEQANVAVKVKATSEGSFEIDLSLWQHVLDSIFTYSETHRDGIAAANELTDLVMKAAGGLTGGVMCVGGGLLALLKWLRGRKPDHIEERGGDVIIHIGDTSFLTNRRTVQLAENVAVRTQARQLVGALERDGIESISARRSGEEELTIYREDVHSFDLPAETDEERSEELRRVTIQIISLSFKEDNKWRLTDGAEPFTATIEDTEFLRKIANDEISFGKNDYLVCDVRETQVRTAKGLKKERVIVRVVEHQPAARQLKLI
jgi:hypothetical protein